MVLFFLKRQNYSSIQDGASRLGYISPLPVLRLTPLSNSSYPSTQEESLSHGDSANDQSQNFDATDVVARRTLGIML